MFETEFHPTILFLLPALVLIPLECEGGCEEFHGVGIELGWFVWSVRIGIPWRGK